MTQQNGRHVPQLVPLASDDGQRLLKEVHEKRWARQPQLAAVFCKQGHGGSCGIQSCALLLNAAYLGTKTSLKQSPRSLLTASLTSKDKADLPYAENKMLSHPATRQAMKLYGLTTLSYGITLEHVAAILEGHGCQVTCHFAANSSHEEFVRLAKNALAPDSSTGIIVNFHRSFVGQSKPWGHHSPLGAYHEGQGQFLIYDTGGEPESWVGSDVLFNAMNTEDRYSNSPSRGFLIVNVKTSTNNKSSA